MSSDLRLYSGNELITHLDEDHGFANRLICLYCGDALQGEDALIHMTELHSDWPINILDRYVSRMAHSKANMTRNTLCSIQSI